MDRYLLISVLLLLINGMDFNAITTTLDSKSTENNKSSNLTFYLIIAFLVIFNLIMISILFCVFSNICCKGDAAFSVMAESKVSGIKSKTVITDSKIKRTSTTSTTGSSKSKDPTKTVTDPPKQ